MLRDDRGNPILSEDALLQWAVIFARRMAFERLGSALGRLRRRLADCRP